jgi:hypothetical protein
MPYVEVRGKYRTFRYDGDSPLDFTTYNNLLCVVRRPNPTTFITLQQYVPGQGGQFTTFQPGSSYTIVSRYDGTQETYNFDIGPYTRVDRLPSTINVKSPGFYIGLDKNSIVVPLSNYALSVNSPLSSIVNIVYTNGQGNRLQYVYADNFKTGAPLNFTHFLPNSGYELRSRIPFTFFAPLQSEMGDAWSTGANDYGQLGMGYQYSADAGYTQLYGNWDKVVMSSTHAAALSTCGTKKKLFVCGGNAYGQLGLTQPTRVLFNNTMQPTVTATQPVWKELQSIWSWVWDNYGEGLYYRNVLDTENILDVEVGEDFTLIKTDLLLYGCGRMCNMGIAPPGQLENNDYQFTDARGNSFTSYYIPYFTAFLQRDTEASFYYNRGIDLGTYNYIPSDNVKKFQARGWRWFYLDADGRLFGQGKLGASTNVTSNTPIVIPVGATDQSTASNIIDTPGYISTTQLYGPGKPMWRYYEQFYADFESNLTNIAALSTDYKTWLVHGPTNSTANGKGNPSLSTICFYDPNQNAYVPQNDYFLRVYPSWFGFMAIYNGKLYFTSFGGSLNQGYDAGGVYGVGTNFTSRLPTGVAILNNALGINPEEKTQLRALIPLTYMGQPDINWKSLFTTFSYSAAIDNNNKLYVTGFNSSTVLGFSYKSLLGFPSSTSNIYTFTKLNDENIYNINSNVNNLVVYKTNRNPAASPTPVPTMTPTPTPTPVNLVPSDAPNAIFVSNYNSINSNLGDRAWWMRSTDAYNTVTVSPYWAFLNGSRQGGNPYWLTRSVFDFKDNNNVVVGTFGKTGTLFNTFKHIVKNISTWDVTSGINDVVTAGTTVATWNDASQSSPYYQNTVAGGNWPVGHVDMFVHRNSNTAVYVFTQFGGVADNSQTYPAYGPKGAWSFTVNLANNAVGSTTTITSKNLCFNRYNSNCAYYYYADPITMPKVSRPLRKLPDGTVIFKSMYLDSYNPSFPGYLLGANYGAVALIGRYDTPTWNGFTSSVEYVIPNSADTPNTGQSNLPAWTEFAKLGTTYYLAWCTKTISDAQGIGGGYQSGYRTQANLVLRNLQSGTQVQVDTGLNTSTSTPFSNYGNLRMQPYDIIGEPRFNRIYVAYTKYTSYTGNPDSRTNVLGIFLKRYDQNLNLIDNTQLFSYTTDGDFGPALVCPVFSYYVDANRVLKLILAFGSNSAGSVGGVGTVTGDYIFTNTPSINNTWTQVFNRSGSNASRVMMALGAGNNVISI